MKTLERYVFGSFLASFLLAFLVLSFVLTIGLTVQIAGYIVDGAPLSLVGQFAAVSFPEAMQITAPVAFLVSSYLVFSRLSTDSEIAAMRACGVNIWRVMIPPVLFALAFTLFSAWLNNQVVPRGHEIRRALTTRVSSVQSILDMLKPGIPVELEGFTVYAAEKDGNVLRDVTVEDASDPRVTYTYIADSVTVTEEDDEAILLLKNVLRIPFDANNKGAARAATHVQRLKWKESKIRRKEKDLLFGELLEEIGRRAETVRRLKESVQVPVAYLDEDGNREVASPKMVVKRSRQHLTKARVELSKRFAIAFASFCFVLVGIPLGIRAQRKETTIGMAYALVCLLGYFGWWYLCSGSLQKSSSAYPEYLIWLPVPVCVVASILLARKNQ